MLTVQEGLSELAVSAELDDVSFPIVLSTVRDVEQALPGQDDTARMLHFVGLMLDHGFVAVTSPYDDPPGTAWPEHAQGKPAVLERLRREWEALDHEPTFLDLCWFHRPAA